MARLRRVNALGTTRSTERGGVGSSFGRAGGVG